MIFKIASAMLCVFLCACALNEKAEDLKAQKRLELPPSYKILCDPSGTKFLPVMPGGTRLYQYDSFNSGYDSYQEAVTCAWKQYKTKPFPSDTVAWQECLTPLVENLSGIFDSTVVRALHELPDSAQTKIVHNLSTITMMDYHNGFGYDPRDSLAQKNSVVHKIKRTRNGINDTSTKDSYWAEIEVASSDVLLEIGSNNIAADIDSGKVPVIKTLGNKSWRIDFEWPPNATAYLDSLKSMSVKHEFPNMGAPAKGHVLRSIDDFYVWVSPAASRYLDSLKSTAKP